jgi:hypothetical protein
MRLTALEVLTAKKPAHMLTEEKSGNKTAASKAEIAFHKIEIMELASRFETTFDEGQLDEHMETWGESITFESPYMGNLYSPQEYRAALEEFYEQLQKEGGTRHLMTNHEIQLNDQAAEMTSYLTVLNKKTNQWLGAIRYHDKLVVENGMWKFIHRKQVI